MRGLVVERQVVERGVRRRAAPGPADQLLALEQVEIAPDRRLRDIEPLGECCHVESARVDHCGDYLVESGFARHVITLQPLSTKVLSDS